MLRSASFAVMITVMTVAIQPAAAQGPPDPFGAATASAEDLVPVRITVDRDVIHAGETFHVAAIFDIEPHWHIYWMNPGTAGLPTEVEVKAPAGYTVKPMLYPRPKAFRELDGMAFGYEKQTVLFVPVTAPNDLPDGEVELGVSASWLVCKQICLMGSTEATASVRTSTAAAPRTETPPLPADPKLAKLVRTYRAALPRPITKLRGGRVEFDGRLLQVSGPAGGHAKASFFPAEVPGVTFGDAKVRVEGDRFTVEVAVQVKPGNSLGKPMSVKGLVALGEKRDDPSYDFALPLTADGAPR